MRRPQITVSYRFLSSDFINILILYFELITTGEANARKSVTMIGLSAGVIKYPMVKGGPDVLRRPKKMLVTDSK